MCSCFVLWEKRTAPRGVRRESRRTERMDTALTDTALLQTALLVIAGLVAGLGLAAIAAVIARSRTPVIDPEATAAAAAADQRIVELGATVKAMAEALGARQGEL